MGRDIIESLSKKRTRKPTELCHGIFDPEDRNFLT